MAKFFEKARGNINASIADRPAPPGSSGAVRPAGSPPPARDQHGSTVRIRQALHIPLDSIIPDPDQPRTEFDDAELELLAESLKARGQLQPIRVRSIEGSGQFMVVVGERRYRASIKAELKTIDCIVVEGKPSAEDILEEQLVENALRSDLRPVEQARAYQRLMTARNLTQRQLAERLQISNGSVAMALGMLKLPGEIQAKVESGAIAPNTAYELSKVGDPGEQAELAREAEAGRLKRDELQQRVRKPRSPRPGRPAERAIRLGSGETVTISGPGGLDRGKILAALRAALDLVEGEPSEESP